MSWNLYGEVKACSLLCILIEGEDACWSRGIPVGKLFCLLFADPGDGDIGDSCCPVALIWTFNDYAGRFNNGNLYDGEANLSENYP